MRSSISHIDDDSTAWKAAAGVEKRRWSAARDELSTASFLPAGSGQSKAAAVSEKGPNLGAYGAANAQHDALDAFSSSSWHSDHGLIL
ncbi:MULTISPECIES: hypothetical protein [Bradyrhizobium]|uniref:Uncharacterized protein n=1 Tax=Bradyrhizobium septentrionale TaxID=1404411 RepID=A0A973VWH8_9BRAD|nr:MULTISPECIES: hypothetical protein [Bradyrhizobium]QIG97811.1 hypothetical protein G6P99_39535 [Bradyrhizobium sp. 6(2017)]UGY20284.1 hypothetical protein HAP48_0024395 [Bradyrhizobium septentrionale]UGY29116.1 hypothetical protein HU675_0021660 [Bradyrhizobium septentrionale]